jgi:diacylglycerol kinase (ATP)
LSLKVAIILNGISLKKKFFYKKIIPNLSPSYSVTVFETQSSKDAIALATTAVQHNFDVVLAAGGDGTLNQVLNGMLLAGEQIKNLPMLGVIPIGSGNDFARTISMRANANAINDILNAGNFMHCDVGRIFCKDKEGRDVNSYFINVADAGMGPMVLEKVIRSNRFFGSGVAYYKSIISTFFSYKPVDVLVKSEAWKWEGKLRTLAIANGRCFAHGLYIAPDAKPNDGIFSTFLAGEVSVAEFVWHSEKLKHAKKIKHAHVEYNQATHIEIESRLTCAIEADGEWVGYLPAKIEIVPSRIKFLC